MGCSTSVLPQDSNINNRFPNQDGHNSNSKASTSILNENNCHKIDLESMSSGNPEHPESVVNEIESYLNAESEKDENDKHNTTDEETRDNNSVPKPICYSIKLDQDTPVIGNSDNILKRPLPLRLKHLEPLPNPPSLTREKLTKKLISAEEKRKQMMELKRYPYTRQKSFFSDRKGDCQHEEDEFSQSSHSSKENSELIHKKNRLELEKPKRKSNVLRSSSCSDIDEENQFNIR